MKEVKSQGRKKEIVKSKKNKKHHLYILGKSLFWFSVGALLGLFFFLSFVFIFFQKTYSNVIYPGVSVNGINFGTKSQENIIKYFDEKNKKISTTQFVFLSEQGIATVSADQIDFGYDSTLLARQAYLLGKSDNLLSNISFITQAYIGGVNLPPSYRFSEDKLKTFLSPIAEKIDIEPVDALFTFQNGRVSAFRLSSDGKKLDFEPLINQIKSKTLTVVSSQKPLDIYITVPIKIIKPKVSTDKANNLGIKELIATGTSLFQHSIAGRIYNITLASTRLNGVLVAPNEVFSFNKALGDVSSFTGYQQAYIIQNGKTVLGDGGGVCQVSTTLFRALLNAGLPILERQAHAYRVGYYEQDQGPGFDATVYGPTVDLQFKNDTNHYILIQTYVDPTYQRLTFELYGTKDGRTVTLSQAAITNQAAAPEPLYQDDPTLPKGVEKQIDFAATGATATFTRTVEKNGKVIISDKFISNYKPWQAVFLRGTKE
ncbi:MAG: VanW family protein [bacterium]|nr:VanW family protein [bacterium]